MVFEVREKEFLPMATEIGNQHLLVDSTTQQIVRTFEHAPRIQDLTNKIVGMIGDSKENAKEFLEEIRNLLRERFGSTVCQLPRQALGIETC